MCPNGCAKSLRGEKATQVTTREQIDAPPDVWENLTSQNYKIWHCPCGFVWGTKFFEAERPYHHRTAVGYFNGHDAQRKWVIATNTELPNDPDWNNILKQKHSRGR